MADDTGKPLDSNTNDQPDPLYSLVRVSRTTLKVVSVRETRTEVIGAPFYL